MSNFKDMFSLCHQMITRMIVLAMICVSTLTFAESANTAVNAQSEELVVANQIIQQQQKSAPEVIQPIERSTEPTSSNVPLHPTVNTDSPEPQLTTFDQPVIDQAKLLTPEQHQQLSQSIRSIYDAGKAQIALVIVPTTGQQDIFSYSLAIAEKWQLGTAKHDNGLLMVVAVNDRRIQILTGYGLEGVIPDIVAHQIIQQQITPLFKQGQYAQGLQAGINEIDRILSLDPDIARQAAESLKEQQAAAHRQQQAQQNTLGVSLFILITAVFASSLIGRKFSALGAAVAGTTLGLFNGLGLMTSLLLGFGLFVLIISSIAQLVLQIAMSASGGGRGGRGGGSGGGYSGGGGRFGGGGASGSW